MAAIRRSSTIPTATATRTSRNQRPGCVSRVDQAARPDVVHNSVRLRVLGAVAAAAAAAFLGALVSLHLLRSDLSPVADFVSDYANGPHGSLFIGTGIVHGLGNLALAAGLGYVVGGSRPGRWGVVLFGASSVGLLIGAAFPTDPPDVPATTVGLIHRTAAYLSFPIELVALTLLAVVFADRLAWRLHARLTRMVCLLGASALLWLVVALAVGWPAGLPERGALGVFLVWELGTGIRLVFGPLDRPCDHDRVHPRQALPSGTSDRQTG